MRLNMRLNRLEREVSGDPALEGQWIAFMTALIAFGQEREGVTPEMAAQIRAEARYDAGRGLEATMRDVLRGMGERGDESEAHA